jgi:hypothetical protein
VLALLLRSVPWRGRPIGAVFAGCWLWVTWFYLLQHYEPINWAARYFAVGFAIQALLLLWTGVLRDRVRTRSPTDPAGAAGIGLFVYGLALHPLVGPLLLGRPWAQGEAFGVTPDPTVIATLGVLVAAGRPLWHLLALPVLWCAIGGATLWTMQSPDAPVMPVAAAIALAFAAWKSLARTA